MLTMSNLNMAITAMIKQNISQDAATISHCQLDPSWQLTTSEGEYSSSQGVLSTIFLPQPRLELIEIAFIVADRRIRLE